MENAAEPAAGTRTAPWWHEPGAWFWAAVGIGASMRVLLAVASEGTYDVPIWEGHARGVHELGLSGYYRAGQKFNHPPPIGLLLTQVWLWCEASGFPFRIALRMPFVAADCASAMLLLRVLAAHPARYALAAAYWMHPLAWILSGHHGNTDPTVGCFVLGAILLTADRRPLAAGLVLGTCLWIKLPGSVAAATLFFAFPTWRERIRFGAVAGTVAFAGYLPALLVDAEALIDAVILYGGQNIQSTAGIRVWGIQNFFVHPDELPAALQGAYLGFVDGLYRFNTLIAMLPGVLIGWSRRDERSAIAIGETAARSYVAFYGLTNLWAFQYFAWAIPLWFLLDRPFAIAVHVAATAYITSLYVWLHGNPWLLGEWDFSGNPIWPVWLLLLRNATITVFFIGALLTTGAALRSEWQRIFPDGDAREAGAGRS